jgi:hypothetical protein
MDSGQPDRQVLSVNHLDLGAGPGDAFEVAIELRDGGSIVLTRQYFLDPVVDPAGPIAIEVLDGPVAGCDSRDAAGAAAAGWMRAARCVEALTAPNLLGDPRRRDSTMTAAAAPEPSSAPAAVAPRQNASLVRRARRRRAGSHRCPTPLHPIRRHAGQHSREHRPEELGCPSMIVRRSSESSTITKRW